MIGQPTTRVDGPVKVTGRATYAYEYWQDEPPLYGVVVTATIGRGRITGNRYIPRGTITWCPCRDHSRERAASRRP